MPTVIIPDEAKLTAAYKDTVQKLESGESHEPQLIDENITRSDAEAFADKVGRSGFIFESHSPDSLFGKLYLFFDPTGVHERTSFLVVWGILAWFWPWARAGPGSLLVGAKSERCSFGSSFREPDDSIYLYGANTPNVVIEVAYSQSRSELLEDMARWTGGPARVAIGVHVEYATPDGVPPEIEVFVQLATQPQPTTIVRCGAGSTCIAPTTPEHTVLLPLDGLVFGASWPVRMALTCQMAATVFLHSVVWGLVLIYLDVWCGRRSVRRVPGAVVRCITRRWWGVVPLDTFAVREAVFNKLGLSHLVQVRC